MRSLREPKVQALLDRWKYQGPPVVTAEDLLQWVSLLPH